MSRWFLSVVALLSGSVIYVKELEAHTVDAHAI